MSQVGRRQFLVSAGALLAAQLAHGQRAARVPVVGALYPNTSTRPLGGRQVKVVDYFYANWLGAFGWVVGKDVHIEDASAEGDNDRLPALAAELVAKKVDVIWVAGPEAATAAAHATTIIPIVFYGLAYPVEQGFVRSLARPGGNITGIAFLAGDEELKKLEMLREILPEATRLAQLVTDTARRKVSGERLAPPEDAIRATATKLGFEVRSYRVSRPTDFDSAFTAILADKAEALIVPFTALVFRERSRIADFARRSGLPSVHGAVPLVEAGGLVSYSADRIWMQKYSWGYVDRILRGANPAELPVELPSKFDLVLNLNTAKALGLTIPSSLLLRADRVIE